jgi:trimeric autotransporter adhesin
MFLWQFAFEPSTIKIIAMKTKILFPIFLLPFTIYLASAQVPQGFNYQAIASNASGNPIKDTEIQVKMSILSDTLLPVTVWEEIHSSVRTDQRGVFSLVIGSGVRQTTSSAAAFAEIDWLASQLFIKTQIYYQSDWKNMGSAKLWSVPYAMVSGSFGGSVKKLEVNGDTSNLDEALFEVKNKDGQTVFAVYNEGVRVYVDNGSKGVKGGFSIGGFGAAKGVSQEYFVVSADSIRAYIYDDPLVKSVKGGFSIGGFGNPASKGLTNDYLIISPDSTRVYVNNALSSKSKKGGFAIGGFNPGKGNTPQELLTVSDDSIRMYIDNISKSIKGGFAIGGFNLDKGGNVNFMNVTPDSTRIYTTDNEQGFGVGSLVSGKTDNYLKLTPENYFIGHRSGKSILTGKYNSFLGFESGMQTQDGDENIFIGYQTGLNNISGKWNTFLGYQAGLINTGSDNTFIGYKAGRAHQTKGGNVYIGSKAGEFAENGEQNVLIGESVGSKITTGSQNIMIGVATGLENSEGSNNIFFGNMSGYNNINGSSNVFLGYQSGFKNQRGANNVYLGNNTGHEADTSNCNVFLGSQAGFFNRSDNNIFIGDSAGYANVGGNNNIYLGAKSGNGNGNGKRNVFLGYMVGSSTNKGENNVFLGTEAGSSNRSDNNIFIGYRAGFKNGGDGLITGAYNVFLGYNAGFENTNGQSNVLIGQNAGHDNTTGSNNTIIGSNAGSVFHGSNNIFIGYSAGSQEAGSNKLYIANNNTLSPLIWGDFSGHTVVVNGNSSDNAGVKNFYVNGSSGGMEPWASVSDGRLKKNVTTIPEALKKVLKLRGVNFEWINPDNHENGLRIGFIAQEAEKVIPEVVDSSNNNYTMQYGPVSALLVEAVKEQEKIIESQQSEIKMLKERIKNIEDILIKNDNK